MGSNATLRNLAGLSCLLINLARVRNFIWPRVEDGGWTRGPSLRSIRASLAGRSTLLLRVAYSVGTFSRAEAVPLQIADTICF